MLRWTTPFLAAMFAVGTAAAQDSGAAKPAGAPAATSPAGGPAVAKPAELPATAKTAPPAAARRAEKSAAARRAAVRAAGQLPSGLPRMHYKYRTTVAPGAPLYVRRGRTVVVEEESLDLPLISGGIEP